MSQSMQVLPPVGRAIPAAGTSGGNAEAPDSGQSFESALAGQLATGETPAGDSRTADSAAPDTVADADAPQATELAACIAAGSGGPGRGRREAAGLLAGETAAPVGAVAGDVQEFSVTPESIADVLVAAVPGIPGSITTTLATPPPGQPPVVLPATEGQSFSASSGPALNRPAVSDVATRSAAADAQTLTALAAEAAATVKMPDMAPALEVFRAALKEIAPAADARPVLTSLLSASGTPMAGGFTNALASAPAGTPVPGASITVPFGQAGWGQAFGNQVVWVANQGAPAAELHLSPPDLGPLSVRISMDQDQASISFSSAHAMVREAVEATLPRLRDMLGAQGITLADVNVSQHGSSQAQHEPGAGWSARRDGDAQTGATDVAVPQRVAAGVLDIYV